MQKKGESQRIDVVGVGENSVDLLATVPRHPAPNEKLELLDFRVLPGGQIASALVACARQGASTRYLGTFGDDERARLIEDALRREDVDTTSCRRVHAANRSALIMVDPSTGTRTVLWQRAAALSWPAGEFSAELIWDAKMLLVDTTDLETSVLAARCARGLGITVVADVEEPLPGLERLLEHVNILITAQGFPHAATGNPVLERSMPKLRTRFGADVIVVTLGAEGAVAWDGTVETWSPGFVVPVADSTGAGDAFRGGFICAWLAGGATGGRLADVLEWANATAALSCRAVGAQTGLPGRAEVQALVTGKAVSRSNRHGRARRRRN